MEKVEKIKCNGLFTNYIYKAIPLVFDESMSYYEVLSGLIAYLKDTVVPTVNNNSEIVMELQSFVEHYFDNLDVQEEINNKLDKMVLNGQLANIINNQYNELIDLTNNKIEEVRNEVNESINGLNTKVNSVLSIAPTPVDSLDKMTDTSKLYLLTSNGQWYYYNGSNFISGGVYQATNETDSINHLSSFIGYFYQSSILRNNQKSIQIDFPITMSNNEKFIYNIISFVKANNVNVTGFTIYGFNGSSYDTIKNYGNSFTLSDTIVSNGNYTGIRIYIEVSAVDTTLSANASIITIDRECIISDINTIKNNIGNGYIEITNKRADGIYSQFDTNVNSNEDLYVILQSFDNSPTYFTIFGYPTISSNAEILYTTQNPNNVKGNIIHVKTTKSYERFRLFLGYSNTGVTHTENALFSFIKGNDNVIARLFKLQNNINGNTVYNKKTFKIFKKVVCCGDSYTSGHIVDSNNVAHETNEEFAWPHYMATSSGNNYVNCGKSGANSNTWLTNSRGLLKAQASGKSQAYILGLGINDSSSDSSRNLTLGSSSDIGTENVTFYGRYSKIIRELYTISPKAKIFLLTCPSTDTTRYNPYNNAIRTINNQYKNIYNTHLIDLVNYQDLYNINSLTSDSLGGHYTALGYEQFAEILEHILSDYIDTHVSDFQDVAFIPYD